MSDRGVIQRITVSIAYPDGTKKKSVLEGADLERLAAIAIKRDAIGAMLKDDSTRAEALAVYDEGHKGSGTQQPAMLLYYDNQTFSLRCDPSDHRPDPD